MEVGGVNEEEQNIGKRRKGSNRKDEEGREKKVEGDGGKESKISRLTV